MDTDTDHSQSANLLLSDSTHQQRLERTLADLVDELEQLLQRMDREVSREAPVGIRKSSDPYNLCTNLIREIDVSANDMQRRLGYFESLNYELQLQLKARASESLTDGLTGLANRRCFDCEFEKRFLAAKQNSCPLVVVLIDIDHFKLVNDNFGHHIGDAVLRGIATLIKSNLPPETLLARFGGEEFVLAISGVPIDNAIEIAERVRTAVCNTEFRHDGRRLGLTISSGLAQLLPQDFSDRILQRADSAMYAAKQGGRNRTFWIIEDRIHHLATDSKNDADAESPMGDLTRDIVELSSYRAPSSAKRNDVLAQTVSAFNLRETRANWCDGAMLFWNLRQRIAELKEGGGAFCVLAIEIDGASELAACYGPVALHYMMRVQLLHLDTNLRSKDIVARTGGTRIIVVLPQIKMDAVTQILSRLRESMQRFAFPTATELVEYSISIGVVEASTKEDAKQLVHRAELALSQAQGKGKAEFCLATQR